MKITFIAGLICLFVPSLGLACYINKELEKAITSVESNPNNLQIAFTDRIDPWNKTMGVYVTFTGETKSFAGYLKFNQDNCINTFSDIKELTPIQ